MRTIVKGKNIEVPVRVRTYAERKFARLERVLDDRTDAIVELSVEQHRRIDDSHIAEATLVIDGTTLRGRATGPTHQAGLDELVDKMERRAVAHKEKPRLRSRPADEKDILRRIADGTADRSREPRIVKTKRFAIEPMFEEDAVAGMEDLGHGFFVFVNAETEHVAVLYRRRDGDYGLIEPIIGGGYGRRPVSTGTTRDGRRPGGNGLGSRAARSTKGPRETPPTG